MYVPEELLSTASKYREARLELLEPLLRSLQGKPPRGTTNGPAGWRARPIGPDRAYAARDAAAARRSGAGGQAAGRVQRTGQASRSSRGAPRLIAVLQHPASTLRQSHWALLLVALATVYLVVNSRLPGLLRPELSVYLAQPLAWVALGAVAFYGWRFTLSRAPRATAPLMGLAGLIGLTQVSLLAIAGLIFGFGYSPYARGLPEILGNLFFVGSALVGVELARAYLVIVLSRGNPALAVGSVSLLMALISIPLGQLTAATSPGEFFEFAGGSFLPELAVSLLASLLALRGGPWVSLAYRGLPLAFEWLSPILPNLSWPLVGLVWTLGPTLGAMVIRDRLGFPSRSMASRRAGNEGMSDSWLLVALFAVIIIWLNTGLFGIQPTLVSGPSMLPTLHAGDIVVTRDVPIGEIEVGDIVRFRSGGSHIIHRVVEIDRSEGGSRITTKGDANNTADPPIGEGQLAGKVILTLPKLGWLGIGLRRVLELLR
jgi:signal peptidase